MRGDACGSERKTISAILKDNHDDIIAEMTLSLNLDSNANTSAKIIKTKQNQTKREEKRREEKKPVEDQRP